MYECDTHKLTKYQSYILMCGHKACRLCFIYKILNNPQITDENGQIIAGVNLIKTEFDEEGCSIFKCLNNHCYSFISYQDMSLFFGQEYV